MGYRLGHVDELASAHDGEGAERPACMKFPDRLEAAQQRTNSTLAIGIAPALKKLPYEIQRYDDPFLPFGKAIIDSTADLVCGYVFHLGPYLALGAAGAKALERTIAYVPDHLVKILHGPFVSEELVRGVIEGFGVDALTFEALESSESGIDVIVGANRGYLVKAPEWFTMAVPTEHDAGFYTDLGDHHYLIGMVRIPTLHVDWYDDIIYVSQGDDFREAMRNAALKLRSR